MGKLRQSQTAAVCFRVCMGGLTASSCPFHGHPERCWQWGWGVREGRTHLHVAGKHLGRAWPPQRQVLAHTGSSLLPAQPGARVSLLRCAGGLGQEGSRSRCLGLSGGCSCARCGGPAASTAHFQPENLHINFALGGAPALPHSSSLFPARGTLTLVSCSLRTERVNYPQSPQLRECRPPDRSPVGGG